MAHSSSHIIAFDPAILGLGAALQRLEPRATLLEIRDQPSLDRALTQAQALFVRTQWKLAESCLHNSSLRFIASASAGIDHIDRRACRARGIEVAYAPGCNASAVAQWTLSVWLERVVARGDAAALCPLGIVGLGHVGSALARMLDILDLPWMACDPPRELAKEASDRVYSNLVVPPRWYSFAQLCENAKTLLFHVPLTYDGPHPSAGMLHAKLAEDVVRNEICVINNSRGEILEYLPESKARPGCEWAVDVWPGEPDTIDWSWLDPKRVSPLAWATPHIAGYGLDAKLQATRDVLSSYCIWSGRAEADLVPVFRTLAEQCSGPKPPPLPWSWSDSWGADERMSNFAYWSALSKRLSPVAELQRDDAQMRAIAKMPGELRAPQYRALRRNYSFRPGFCDLRLQLCSAGDVGPEARPCSLQAMCLSQLRRLGLSVIEG